jgi:hypothetical protein
MAAIALGIFQANVCRYVRNMVKSGAAGVVRKSPCHISGRNAEWLTTDPERIPAQNQLDMFDGANHVD